MKEESDVKVSGIEEEMKVITRSNRELLLSVAPVILFLGVFIRKKS